MAKVDYMSASDVTAAYKDGINNCGKNFAEGVANPRQNPIQAAIKAINAGIWEKNFRASIEKWAKNTAAVSLNEWVSAAVAAAGIYQSGATGVGTTNYKAYYGRVKSAAEGIYKTFNESGKTQADYTAMWAAINKAAESAK